MKIKLSFFTKFGSAIYEHSGHMACNDHNVLGPNRVTNINSRFFRTDKTGLLSNFYWTHFGILASMTA